MKAINDHTGKRQILAIAEDETPQAEAAEDARHKLKNKITSPKGNIQVIRNAVEKHHWGKELGSLCLMIESGLSELNSHFETGLRVSPGYGKTTTDSEELPDEEKPRPVSGEPGPNEFIFNNLPFGLALLNNTGHIIIANPYLRESSGLDPTPFSYSRLPYMVSGSDTVSETSWFRELTTGEINSYDTLHIDDTGEKRKYIRFDFLRHKDGSTVLTAIARDVTSEVEELDRLRETSVAMIDELRKVAGDLGQKIAATGDVPAASLGGFLGYVNSGLEKIRLYTACGLVYPLSSEVFEKREPVKINALLVDSLREVEYLSAMWGITVKSDINDVPEIIANREESKEALLNLITNAAHAMLDPGRTTRELRVYCGMVAQKPNTIKVEISDTGVGIPDEDLSRIGQRGFTTKKDIKHLRDIGITGTGFGLTQVLRAIRNHGGTTHIVSLTQEKIDASPDDYPPGTKPGTIVEILLHVMPQR